MIASIGLDPFGRWTDASLSRPWRAKPVAVVIERRELIAVIGELSNRDCLCLTLGELVLP